MLNQIGPWLTLFVDPDVSVFLWYRVGTPIFITYLYVSLHASLITALFFLGVDLLKTLKRIVKRKGKSTKTKDSLPFYKKAETGHRFAQGKVVGWLKRQRGVIIFIVSCIPIVPILPAAAMVAAKILEIKHGLILILIGTAIRNALVVIGIYYGFSFFFPLD